MRRIQRRFGAALVALGLSTGSGCSYIEDLMGESAAEHAAQHAHHDGDEAEQLHAGHEHDHTHVGPNGTPLIILGEHEYHAELNIDTAQGSVTVVLLDRTGRKPYPIEQESVLLNLLLNRQPHQIRLTAAPQPTDPPASSSRFEGSDSILLEPQRLQGRLNIVIEGKPYTGALAQSEDSKVMR
jgi:hypothetical protein